MMAGSITLGTYDTFNYFAAQAEKRSSPWVSRMARSEIDNLLCVLCGPLRSLC